MLELTVSATAHGLNYLPEYLANHTGLFAEHGIKVTTQARDPWIGVLEDLDTGAADVALGGLWVPAMYAGTDRDLVVVGQLNARFPMTVVTREPVDDFAWSWLRGRTVLVPGAGGTAPYEFTAGLIREAGADPAATRFVRDLPAVMLTELFTAGLGDAYVTDLMTATALSHAGIGAMSRQLADVGGPMPNSVYYVRRDRLTELQPVLGRFLAAISTAMTRLARSAPDDLSELLAAEWPGADPAVLRTATGLLIGNRTWSGIRVEPAATDRWISILRTAGLITSPVSYQDFVDTGAVELAETALA